MIGLRLSKKLVITVLLIGLIVVAVSLGILFGLLKNADSDTHTRPYSTSFKKAAVVTNGKECAEIGRDMLLRGGSAADAVIAALICEGVSCAQSMGIGGGFLMTIYNRKSKTFETLNARESAPAAATEDMFSGQPSLAATGGLAIAVPGELRGYETLHKKYGKLPWKDLFQPTIQLCRDGTRVTEYFAKILRSKENKIKKTPSLSEIFINPKTNSVWRQGDLVKRPKLGETLEIIAQYGADALYDGVLTKDFINDIKNFNGIITEDDLKNYRAVWSDAVSVDLPYQMQMYTSELPGSGILLKFFMNVLKDFLPDVLDNEITWQRIVEAFKFMYGIRTLLGDPTYNPEIRKTENEIKTTQFALKIREKINDTRTSNNASDYFANFIQPDDNGTAHICVVAPNGDAIAVTSTINLIFGSFRRSPSTGIILNDEMDDFSNPNITNAFDVPPSAANLIKPFKRPLSSMCPSIIVDSNGDVQLVVGGAGGTRITSSVAQIILRRIFYNQPIVDAMIAPRIHHQLYPMVLGTEAAFSPVILRSLRNKGHIIAVRDPGDGFASVTAISRENNTWVPFSDIRRNGSVAGIN